MRYTTEGTAKGKKVWRFRAPHDVHSAGIMKSQTFHDGRTMRHEVPKLLNIIDTYRSGAYTEGALGSRPLVVHLRNHYLESEYFRQLAGSSQKQYESLLDIICMTYSGSKTLGEHKVSNISSSACRIAYDKWVKHGSAATANTKARIFSVLLNYAVGLELLVYNPMSKVRKLKHTPTTKIWTQDQVETYLAMGYEDFKTSNVTLLTHMCYEWGQRPLDIAHLKWDQFDWDNNSVTITQTKRGATVHLPFDGSLLQMLSEQKARWDFQPYVVPHQIPSGSVYMPMNHGQINNLFSYVRELAGLSSDLLLGALRKTAIMEMVEAGVDSTGIMQVSGHKNISSLNPYMKHTLSGAKRALSQRRK